MLICRRVCPARTQLPISATGAASTFLTMPEQRCAQKYLQSLMSGEGDCHDHGAVETFFNVMMAAMIWPHIWQTRCTAEPAISQHISGVDCPRSFQFATGSMRATFLISLAKIERAKQNSASVNSGGQAYRPEIEMIPRHLCTYRLLPAISSQMNVSAAVRDWVPLGVPKASNT
jgi:hypothetical protein